MHLIPAESDASDTSLIKPKQTALFLSDASDTSFIKPKSITLFFQFSHMYKVNNHINHTTLIKWLPYKHCNMYIATTSNKKRICET